MITDTSENFFSLTPSRILDAVEQLGFRCTGRSIALNSLENRVYEVEIEIDEETRRTPSDSLRVVKFYRPHRWSRNQILEEHAFCHALAKAELPVIAPVKNEAGDSLLEIPELGLFCAVFPKRAGRLEPELSDQRLSQLGRLLARIHAIGRSNSFTERLRLDPTTYGKKNLQFLLDGNFIPTELVESYTSLVSTLVEVLERYFADTRLQPIHGDFHHGNILWADDSPRVLDFDDMVIGPPAQDIWLILPGRDQEGLRQREVMLRAYEQFADFDRRSLRLVEGLRALRFIHFSAWIAKRWSDPTFPHHFPHFGTFSYWREQVADLTEQVDLLQSGSSP